MVRRELTTCCLGNTSDDNTGSANFFFVGTRFPFVCPNTFVSRKSHPSWWLSVIKIVRFQISVTCLWISPSRWTSILMKYCQLAQFIKNIFFVRIGYIIKTIGKHLCNFSSSFRKSIEAIFYFSIVFSVSLICWQYLLALEKLLLLHVSIIYSVAVTYIIVLENFAPSIFATWNLLKACHKTSIKHWPRPAIERDRYEFVKVFSTTM